MRTGYRVLLTCSALLLTSSVALQPARAAPPPPRALASLHGKDLSVSVHADGTYSITRPDSPAAVVHSGLEADVDHRTLRSTEYPRHTVARTAFKDEFGSGSQLVVRHTGLPDSPDLQWTVRLYRDRSWGEMELKVVNSSDRAIHVEAIRSLHALESPVIRLNGPEAADRILSDSFSEDRPMMTIRELADARAGMHRAVGSQLIYNRQSGTSLFLGALTSDRLLTIFHLNVRGEGDHAEIASYEAVATGTTELQKKLALKQSPQSEQVELSLPVNPGESLSSERLMFAVGSDYHAQLEQYADVIRRLHKARVTAQTPMGWWSWTAYYFGLSEGAALTNLQWMADNLRMLGYDYFHIDEGYQYARGEYTTPDVNLFPHGLRYLADQVHQKGLHFGVWTSPFEVSERAWVFEHHKDWLLHNSVGELIHIGRILDRGDPLYVLDTTHPGAQDYLRETYRTLAHDWGVHYIKMDFMDDTAIEGAHYRPNTTALEAQRIGLQIIRQAVGEEVLLDKDGSPMLNPVGIVDTGRISLDTGHKFEGTRDGATGIAARYYMNRNFFVSDPDAFSVSTQTVKDQSWHEGGPPLTLDEARVSIALVAVSGGMFEIGDDLPTLGASPERLALVENSHLIDMARLGRAATPVDLMTYATSDRQPSVFLLRETSRQSILTLFNWTEGELRRAPSLTALGLKQADAYRIEEVFGNNTCFEKSGPALSFTQPPHSVCMLRLVDESVPAADPTVEIRSASDGKSGETLSFEARATSADGPVLTCHWDFGDGSSQDGMAVRHVFTHAGEFVVRATAKGLGGSLSDKSVKVTISGEIPTTFVPEAKMRPQ